MLHCEHNIRPGKQQEIKKLEKFKSKNNNLTLFILITCINLWPKDWP